MIFQENVISPYPKNKKRDGLRCSVQEEKTLCLSGHQLDCEKSYIITVTTFITLFFFLYPGPILLFAQKAALLML